MSPARRSGSAARSQPEVLRGSLFTLRRCGTPTCRCADGGGHASPALAYPAGERTKTCTSARWMRHRPARPRSDTRRRGRSRAWSTARAFLVGGGVTYLVLWLYGLVIDQTSSANFVPVDTADRPLSIGPATGRLPGGATGRPGRAAVGGEP
jgi:hypothetical protein